jgi:hypothetical protein
VREQIARQIITVAKFGERDAACLLKAALRKPDWNPKLESHRQQSEADRIRSLGLALLHPESLQSEVMQPHRIPLASPGKSDDKARNQPRRWVASINQSQFPQHAFERADQDTSVRRKIAVAAIVDRHMLNFAAKAALILSSRARRLWSQGERPRLRSARGGVQGITASCWLKFPQLSNDLSIATTDQAVHGSARRSRFDEGS